jgi:archaellum component FlaF (FlaF/FlaG flagellin family)
MNKPQNYTPEKLVTTFVLIAVFLSVLSITISPVLGSSNTGDFLIPGNGYSVDYYRSYGEPTIEASIKGDLEFERGDVADIKVMLANKGMIEGMKRLNVNQNLIPDSKEELIALAEMSEERNCTIAKGIKANLISESDHIHVEPTTTPQTVDELETGHIQPIKFTIRIDDNTPAGEYEFKLPVTYQYQSNARTVTSNAVDLGLTSDTVAFTQQYLTKNVTLPLHISIKKEPKFEVSKISGSLKQGSTSLINVTYTNRGETSAEDAQAKIVVMSPLSTSKSTVRLGTIGPGESQTASFNISAESDAVAKNYSVDSEVKYIDDDGKTKFSENMKVGLPIEKSESRFSTTMIIGLLLALVLIYQIIKVLRNRKNYSENESGDEND